MIFALTVLFSIAFVSSAEIETADRFGHIFDDLFEEYGCFPNPNSNQSFYTVLLKYGSIDVQEPKCHGTLIHPQYVLTAGHWIRKQLQSVSIGFTDYSIEKTTRHPDFNATKKTNDIAIIKLFKAVDKVKPICLPFSFELQEKVLQTLDVITYNLLEPVHYSPNRHTVTVHALDECKKFFSKVELDEGYLCAGDVDGIDVSGAPGQISTEFNGQSINVLYAMPALGIENGEQNRLGAYSNVVYYMDWILDNTKD